MTPNTYAIVTPSFRLDFERCALLCESVQRFVAPAVRHYLVIDRRDVEMFRPLSNARTEIVVVEDVIPWWIMRVPGVRKYWLSLCTVPVRNWILQQLVKLSLPLHVKEDVLLYTDSDTFFRQNFDPLTLERDGRVPLFVEYGQRGKIPSNDRWHSIAAGVFGLLVKADYDTNYIGNVIPWRRENVLKMHRHIEEKAGMAWQRVLAGKLYFSEYILYGMYCETVLGFEAAEHWPDSTLRTHTHWETTPLDRAQLATFKQQALPEHHSVMVSAKSHTVPADIRATFF